MIILDDELVLRVDSSRNGLIKTSPVIQITVFTLFALCQNQAPFLSSSPLPLSNLQVRERPQLHSFFTLNHPVSKMAC